MDLYWQGIRYKTEEQQILSFYQKQQDNGNNQ